MMGPQAGSRLARFDGPLTFQQIRPGTIKRIFPYMKRYRWLLTLLLSTTVVDCVSGVANPLVLALVIDDGILRRRLSVIIWLSAVVAGLAILDAVTSYIQTWSSARLGQGLIYDLRNEVFGHVRQQSLAFFTRSQTGSLVSRLNGDVAGAQSAVTGLLTGALSTVLTLALVLAAMFYLSWEITLAALAIAPFFIWPGKVVGTRLQRLTRQTMMLQAEMGSLMNERFNIGGAMLTKLYGRPRDEEWTFASKSGQLREILVRASVVGRLLGIGLGLLSSLIVALAFGFGGYLVVNHVFQVGVLVALITLLDRLYGPIQGISGLQVQVLTTLVSFDRIFEVLDLKPLVTERPDAHPLPESVLRNGTAPRIDFEHVSFRYPIAKEVSLPSLESIALPRPERSDDAPVLHDISFTAPAGKLTALVGPSGAGKTTITHLVPRLYDPTSGTVRIAGYDIADLTLQSLHEIVGVVTQDAHLFHETIRSNLLFARPEATEDELVEACRSARIWDLVSSLPNGLDTVVGDRGYRLSGGEKQRVALARLLLKAPRIVVLDEATAHLDSESEAAIQRALKTALAGRTSLVIAHRLSTIREADQILVIDAGEIRERGTHQELLDAGGLYAELYHTQFARQAVEDGAGDADGDGSGDGNGDGAQAGPSDPLAAGTLGGPRVVRHSGPRPRGTASLG